MVSRKSGYADRSMNRLQILVSVIAVVLSIVSCRDHQEVKDSEQEKSLKKISQYKIFFGHQSVGYNIIDGLQDLGDKVGFKGLNIYESKSLEDSSTPVFVHCAIGHNKDPISKIVEFANIIGEGMGKVVDIAFFKFCYIDFGEGTDIEPVFREYRDTMTLLKQQFPEVTFVHVTVPLVSRDRGVKALVKWVIGRRLRGYDDNLSREVYNTRLIKEYGKREPIFDLARIESTRPDGNRLSHKKNGTRYYSLAPEYTDDGGHLNQIGRACVARKLSLFLAAVADNRNIGNFY